MDSQFGFTLIDKELIGDTHLSDPLATTSLWSHFGRLIIPNLTEQTHNIQGFHMLCLNLYFYNRYYTSYLGNEGKIGITDFYKTAEQIFAYSYYNKNEEWKLPGKNRLIRLYGAKEKDTVLLKKDRSHEILGNQIANGTWGLYRGAAIRSRILTDDGFALHPFFADEYVIPYKYESDFIRAIQNVHNSENGYSINLTHKWVQEAASLFKNITYFKKLYRKFLIENFPGLPEFSAAVASYGNFENEKKRSLILSLSNDFPEKRILLEDVIKCENIIGTLNSVFSFIYSHTSKDINKIALSLEKKLSLIVLKNAFIAFNNIVNKPKSGIAYDSYKILCDNSNIKNHYDLLEWIISKHVEVCEIRRSSPWIESENGKFKIYEEINPSEELTVIPGKGWMHDYYLTPLFNIYNSVK